MFCTTCVGLSNILDRELERRKPGERSHGEEVGAAVVDSELLSEVVQGVKTAVGVEALLVLPMAALDLSIVTWGVGTDELVADAQLCSGNFKQSRNISFAVGKTVGELKAIVGPDTLDVKTAAGIQLTSFCRKSAEEQVDCSG